jgi:hypothetical protein
MTSSVSQISRKAVSIVTIRMARGSFRTPISVRRNVQTPQQTPIKESICSHRCPDNPADINSREHLFSQVSGQQTEGYEQWRQHATIRTLRLRRLNTLLKTSKEKRIIWSRLLLDVWTSSVLVWTPPSEIRVCVKLGFPKSIYF